MAVTCAMLSVGLMKVQPLDSFSSTSKQCVVVPPTCRRLTVLVAELHFLHNGFHKRKTFVV